MVNTYKRTEEWKKMMSLKMKGRVITWGDKISKAKKGHGWPEEYHEKQSKAQKKRFEMEDPWNKGLYKNGKMSYCSLHNWVRSKLGTPSKCEHCGKEEEGRYHSANKSGKYLQDIKDWIRLCPKCHVYYDGTYKNLNYIRKK